MCRMLVHRGEVAIRDLVEAAAAMSRGETADHEHFEDDGRPWDHLDGWGLLVLDEHGRWRCARGAGAISEAAVDAFAPLTTTTLAVVHLRKASDPQYLGMSFSHPVEIERDGQTCYFFHNGYAPEVGAMIGQPEGWDSRRLLEYLLPALGTALGEDDAPLRELLEALPPSTTSANFIFVEGEEITVGNWYPRKTEHPRYYAYRVAAEDERLVIASDAVPSLMRGQPFRLARARSFARLTPATKVREIIGKLAEMAA